MSTSPVRHAFARAADGTRIFYSVEGAGPPLVFCYGLVCSSLHWTYQIDALRSRYQAVWFDYRGHQNSDIPNNLDSLRLEVLAEDLDLVINQVRSEFAGRKPIILGHSMGVNVALEYYRQNPGAVGGLVLANGTPKPPLHSAFHSNVLQIAFGALRTAYKVSPGLLKRYWRTQDKSSLVRLLITFGGFNPYLTHRKDIEHYIGQVAAMDPAIIVHLLNNYNLTDSTPWLHKIKVPTLIIGGRQDHIIPIEQQLLLHQLIPDSLLEVIEHGSHCPQMDLPELVTMKIEKFAERVFGAPK